MPNVASPATSPGWLDAEAEKDAVAELLDQAAGGEGTVVTVTGRPGVGKTRLMREALATARGSGFEVFVTYCESHTREVPLQVISRLLRAVFGIVGLPLRRRGPGSAARSPGPGRRICSCSMTCWACAVGLSGYRSGRPAPSLVELIRTVSLARPAPAIYLVEDVQWIDSVSESLLADFAAMVPRMRATLLVVYRPEYSGSLSVITGAHPV